MRNRVLGLIGVVWGGAILLYGMLGNRAESEGAYQSGQGFGFIFGLALFVVGLYYLLRGPGKKGVPRNKYSHVRGTTRSR